jgi:hypothetical protein
LFLFLFHSEIFFFSFFFGGKTLPTHSRKKNQHWCIKYLTLHVASISGGSILLLHLVSAIAVQEAAIRPLLLVLEMRAQPLEAHHLFRCQCSGLLLLVVRQSKPPLHRHRRRHLCNNPTVIAWFGQLARCRQVFLNAILFLQQHSFLQALQVSAPPCCLTCPFGPVELPFNFD